MADNLAFDGPITVTKKYKDSNGEEVEEDLIFDPANGKLIEPYAGMPAEMVRYYSNTFFYRMIRYALVLVLLATMVTLCVLSGVTISTSAPCLEKWQEKPIYQVYPRSFYDSDNDGYGDLQGITQKLDYIEDLGVGSVWLNPIYDSPQGDMGYDVRDYRKIWETFGDMEDFDQLLDEMHKRGLKLIMDFVPNHTSNQHAWFVASEDPNHPDHAQYRDYYVWKDQNLDSDCHNYWNNYTYPNNWLSDFGGSAWTWSEKRQQYYLHQFYDIQPDLNLENQNVVQELLDILEFWLDKGVDGFRIDAVPYTHEAQHFRDEYPNFDRIAKDNYHLSDTGVYCSDQDSDRLDIYHDFTQYQNGMHDLLENMRNVALKYSKEPGVDIVMITEAYDQVKQAKEASRFYGTEQALEASFPFNFWLVQYLQENDFESQGWDAKVIDQQVISRWLAAPKMTNEKVYADREWPNWVMGNHDNPRMATKIQTAPEFAKSMAVMLLTLPGTQTLYYGDEIGMIDVDVTTIVVDDRDRCRAPMQWDNSEWAGFTNSSTGPWVKVNPETYPANVNAINVEDELADENSILNLYKKLIQMNTENLQIHRGYYCSFNLAMEQTPNVLGYLREQTGLKTGFLVLINFSGQTASLNLNSLDFGSLNLEKNMVMMDSDMESQSQTKIETNGNDYSFVIEKYGFIVVEYEMDGLYNDREGSECYVAREVRMRGDIAFKV